MSNYEYTLLTTHLLGIAIYEQAGPDFSGSGWAANRSLQLWFKLRTRIF